MLLNFIINWISHYLIYIVAFILGFVYRKLGFIKTLAGLLLLIIVVNVDLTKLINM